MLGIIRSTNGASLDSGCDVARYVQQHAPASKDALLSEMARKPGPGTCYANLLVSELLLSHELAPKEKAQVVRTLLGSLDLEKAVGVKSVSLPLPWLGYAQRAVIVVSDPTGTSGADPPAIFRGQLARRIALVLQSLGSLPIDVADRLLALLESRQCPEGDYYFACVLARCCHDREKTVAITPRVLKLLTRNLCRFGSSDFNAFDGGLPEGIEYDLDALPEVTYRVYSPEEQRIREELCTEGFSFLEYTVCIEHPSWPHSTTDALYNIIRRAGPRACAMIMDQLDNWPEAQDRPREDDFTVGFDLERGKLGELEADSLLPVDYVREELLELAAELQPADERVKAAFWEHLEKEHTTWASCEIIRRIEFTSSERRRLLRRLEEELQPMQSAGRVGYSDSMIRLSVGETLWALGDTQNGSFHILSVVSKAGYYDEHFGMDRIFAMPTSGHLLSRREDGLGPLLALLSDDDWHIRYWAATVVRMAPEIRDEMSPILAFLARTDESPFVRAKCEQVLTSPDKPVAVGWLSALVSQPAFTLSVSDNVSPLNRK